ncbi:MAG: sec-independent protein translocase protein TatA [Candidatus Endobugula sp.]|jgi:sec-independent protein translocase protein TatA
MNERVDLACQALIKKHHAQNNELDIGRNIMGIGGIGVGPLLLILAIVILLFGTKKLKSLGSDLGGAVKGFKKAINTAELTNEDLAKSDETEVTENLKVNNEET